MPSAQSLLCPKCGRNPRRKPGQRCTPCEASRQREYRKRWAKGEKSARVPAESTKRFTRPLDSKRYIITSAQNATPVDDYFFDALELAAKHLGAELVVIPLRYKNPTSIWSSKQESDEWWAPRTAPYLFNARKKLGANLVLVGDFKIQPTAISPLSGCESLTGAESCILGHPKMQLRSVPAPTARLPKILSTTGACTKRNYTDTRAGKLGEFHHCLGAVIVELQGKKFHLRQINADRNDGSFIDLDRHYSRAGVKKAPPALGLVMGDTHVRFTCPDVDRATFGKGGIVDTLQPKTLVFHDLFDGYAVNHHHQGNAFIAHAKAKAGFSDPLREIEDTVAFVRERAKGREAVIVASNHDDFLNRWILGSDWRHVGAKEFYLETALAMLKATKMSAGGAEIPDPFAYWVEKLKRGANVRALGSNESFKLADIECGMHGHRGPNGAKGTLRNLSRLGARTIVGHAHTPGIEEGGYQVGTSTKLRLEYTNGPSSWLNAHCAVYASGKRSLLIIVDGEWRARPAPLAATRRKAA